MRFHFAMMNSIGSLGAGKSKEFVSGIIVNGAKFIGTTNGVRIKTWQVIGILNSFNFSFLAQPT